MPFATLHLLYCYRQSRDGFVFGLLMSCRVVEVKPSILLIRSRPVSSSLGVACRPHLEEQTPLNINAQEEVINMSLSSVSILSLLGS